MPGKYKFGTSRLAIWALWFSRLAIPVAILSFLLMRFGGMHPSVAIYCFGAALALALVAILISLAAFPAIWFEGLVGGKRLWGTFLRSLIVIVPTLVLAFFYYDRPQFSDVSTNPLDPPEYIAAWQLRHDADNSLDLVSLDDREKQALAYPNLEGLTITQPIELVHLLVLDEIKKQKWEMLFESDHRYAAEGSLFEATTRSIITGLRYAIAVRLKPDGEDRTILDVRSASLWGPHDLGLNARRISGFIDSVEKRLKESVKRFELELEEIERQRRIERGPLPRPKPQSRPIQTS